MATLIIDALGGITQRVYNAYGELEIERDPLGHATLYDYSARGLITQMTYPDGTTIQYAYNQQDLPVQAIDANGQSWTWQYDEAGNLRETHDPLRAINRHRYHNGLLVELTDAAGHHLQLAYDTQYNLQLVVAPDGGIRSRQYDQLGRVVRRTDATGAVQRRHYDFLGQLIAVVDPANTQREFRYDGEGNLILTTDEQQEVAYDYTGQGSLARRRQAGTAIQFYYDLEGRLTGLDNENEEPYRFELDALGQVITEQGFDGLLRRYERDAAGRVTHIIRPAGRRTSYTYTPTGQLAEVVYNDETPITYAYRADGALLKASTATTTVAFERDALGRVVQETQHTQRFFQI